MKRMIGHIGISVLAIILGATGWAQDQGTDNGREFHWTGKLSPDQVVMIKNINGDIEATGSANGDQVEVSAVKSGENAQDDSVNGSINISTLSWASAKSVNGSIQAKIGRADWSGDLEFKTVNGSVKLELPSNLNTELDFKSVNGRLESDFPLTMQGSIGKHSVHGTIGNGCGRSLEINTVNGGGELRKEAI